MSVIPTKKYEAVVVARPTERLIARHVYQRLLTRTGIYIVLTLLALLQIFPLVWMVLTSLKDRREVFSGPLLPSTLHFDNYLRVWTALDAPIHFANSLI